jgi:hypothetical protein
MGYPCAEEPYMEIVIELVKVFTYLVCVTLLFLPFWLFARLLKKRQGEQRGYGDDNNYSGPIGPA